ncbi:hypothetical protein BOX15_Mlig016864g1 [Macrostomum lignano]|uniref:Protein kinase domain-containing protein n=1 Tax=Macrostomum lignano TaxID=282301 RepID=A0A267GCE0_9PLAT|nr:hypothetical protein BOX15_Mlig016864g1 [Macrostomum lignano]
MEKLLRDLHPELQEMLTNAEVPRDFRQLKKHLKRQQMELKKHLKQLQKKEKEEKETSSESSSSESDEDGDDQMEAEVKALFSSVKMGDFNFCSHILQTGVNVNSTGPKKATPLHLAAQEDKADIANLLLSRGADVNAVDRVGNTPLMIAVMRTHRLLIRILVERGTDLKKKNKQSLTAADIALMLEDLEILELLEAKQKAVQYDSKVHDKTILRLVSKGKTQMIDFWLKNFRKKENKCSADQQYKDGRTIAFAAALSGSMEILELVDKYGANLDLPDNSNSSPLFCAAQNGFEKIVKLLLDKGCDVNRVNKNGRTPLFFAIQTSNLCISNLLIEAGADVNKRDANETCPLAHSILSGSQEIFDLLIEKNANPRVFDKDGHDLVILSTSFKRFEILKKLHKLGLPLDHVNEKDGETPLLTACQTSSPEVVNYLLDNGCNVKVMNKKGITPVLRASAMGDLISVKRLKEHGAQLDVPAVSGDTAILAAALRGKTPLVEFLYKEGCSVTTSDDNGMGLAHLAASKSDTELLDVIRRASAPLDEQDNKGNTPLIIATIQPTNLDLMKQFIELKCNVETKNNKGKTATSIAVEQGSVEALNYLISVGGNLGNITKTGETTTMQAAKGNHLEVMKVISTSASQSNVNSTDINGKTAVHFAALSGRLEIIEFLKNEIKANCDLADKNGNTPFMLAAGKGHKSVAEKLLDFGADIHLRNKNGENSAYLAVKGNHADMLRYLSMKSCYLDQEDKNGVTPLMLACKEKNLEAVNFLLSKDCAKNSVVRNGRQLIHAACEGGSLPVVRRIVNLGVPIDSKDTSGVTPLMIAAGGGFIKVAQFLLEKKKELLSMSDESGKTALDHAILSDHVKIVELLIDSGSDVEHVMDDGRTSLLLALEKSVKDKQKVAALLINSGSDVLKKAADGLSSAHVACKFNKLLSLKKLMEKGVGLDTLTQNGDSCLTLAVPKSDPDLINLLLESELDRRHTNSQGHSAVSLACLRGDEKIFSMMFPLSSDETTKRYSNDNTLLHFACEGGSKEVIQKLITEHHMEVDATNDRSETPLHITCRSGKDDLVTLLLQHHANVDAIDDKGETPIFHAIAKDSIETCTVLIRNGADLNAVNKDGMSVLCKAYYEGRSAIVRLLKSEHPTINANLKQLPGNIGIFSQNLKNMNIKVLKRLFAEGLPVDRREGSAHLLHHAIEFCRSDIINLLLDKNAELRVKDVNGRTPLFQSIIHGRIDMATKILSQCPDAKDDVDNDGNTILHIIVLSGKPSTLQWILGKYTFDKTQANKSGRTALHVAAAVGSMEMYEMLLKKGWDATNKIKASVNSKTKVSVGHLAVLSGNMSFVRQLHETGVLSKHIGKTGPSIPQLLAQAGQMKTLDWFCRSTGVNFEDSGFLSVRNAAFVSGHEQMADWIIKRGVDLEQRDSTNGQPGSLAAVLGGNFHIVRKIFEEQQCSTSARTKHCSSLLHMAVCSRNEPLLRYVLQKGCPREETDNDGGTPILEAVWASNCRFVKILHSEYQCNLKKECKLQFNAAHYAAITGNLEIFEYIKQHLPEAYFDACNIHGNTPLMLAVLYSKSESVKYLLEKFSPEIDNKNKTSSTALHWAALNADKNITELLLDRNPTVDIQDMDGATPLMLAVQSDSVDCADLLLRKGASATTENTYGESALTLMQHSKDESMRKLSEELQEQLQLERQSGPVFGHSLGHCSLKSIHYNDHFPEEEPAEQLDESDVEIEDEANEEPEAVQQQDEPYQAQSEVRAPSVISRRTAGSAVTRTSVPQSERPSEGRLRGNVISTEVYEAGKSTVSIKIVNPTEANIQQAIKSLEELRKLVSERDVVENHLCRMQPPSLCIEVKTDQPGRPLEDHLEELRDREHRYLPEGTGLKTAKSILSGLKYLHSKGIVHGCLRLTNIRIVGEEIRLGQYGQLMRISRLSQHYQQPGYWRSDPFTAPEERQLTGTGAIDRLFTTSTTAVDMWAFGCTLHEVLIGAPPERGAENLGSDADYVTRTFARVQNLDNVPSTMLQQRRIFPENLQNAFLRVYVKLPEDRPSAPTLLNDLQ